MHVNKNATLQELEWKDVRDEVYEKNVELAEIIDDIDPGADYTLFKARYPFGSEILKNGHFYIPNDQGSLVPLNSTEVPIHIQEKLNYNLGSNPASLILSGTVELFIILENNTIPLYGLVQPGKIFGTWRVIDPMIYHHPAFIWNMTSGARSIFMLPKISETTGYNRLRRTFNLKTEKPKLLLDHFKLFREIASHADFGKTWTVELIFFSSKWFERLNDKKWCAFKLYLLEKAWEGSEFFRNQFIWDLAFSLIQQRQNIKPSPYIIDTVRHLLAMGIGALPGFTVALDDSAAPISKLQEVFTEIYQLHDYAPTIMQPSLFSRDIHKPIYYSLQYPTTIEFSPKSCERSTKIFDLYEIKSILNKYLIDINTNRLNLKGTPIFDSINTVQYDFFHTDIENYNGIRPSKEIPKEDASFTKVPLNMNRNFPANSTFVRGCVRISKKDK